MPLSFSPSTAVDRFPMLECEREIASNSIERTRATGSSTGGSAKSQEHNHNREVIFALPSLQLHFKTEHKQGSSTPEPSGNSSVLKYIKVYIKPFVLFSRIQTGSFVQFHNRV